MILFIITAPASDTFTASPSIIMDQVAKDMVPVTEVYDTETETTTYELAEESDGLFGIARPLTTTETMALVAEGCGIYPA